MAVSKKDDYISKRYREGQPGNKFPSFLLTVIIAEELYKQMEPTEQLFYEQKGRRKKKREKKNVHRQNGDKELQKNISEFSYGLD